MNAFWHALAFLTRIPVPWLRPSREAWEASVAFYPLVGLLLGTLLWLAAVLATCLFPLSVAAVLTVIVWVYLTGGLHLDGWMDLADGLGSQRSGDEMLAVMKDSRAGAMGVIAAILLLMVKVGATYEILAAGAHFWLLFFPLAARFLLLVAIRFWPYRTENGIASAFRQNLSPRRMFANFTLVSAVAGFGFGVAGVTVFLGTALLSWMLIERINRRLQGLTGDCYGAVVEWAEACALLLALAIRRLC
ncbi:adenosylcobinamide-GDP ribazoletransferase [Bacillaceae bacterium]